MDATPWAGKSIVAGSIATSKAISRAVAAGNLRPVALNIYTPELTTPLPDLVRAHWMEVVSALAPAAVVTYRTAIERMPAPDGSIFLSGPSRYERRIPGLAITVVKGPGPLPGDEKTGGPLPFASTARALLDAARPTRKRAAVARGLNEEETAALIRSLLMKGGEWAVEELRERMELVAPLIDAQPELVRLSRLIDRILGKTPGARVLFDGAVDYCTAVTWADRPATRSFAEEGFDDAWASYRLAGGAMPAATAHAVVNGDAPPEGAETDAAMLAGIHSVVGRRVPMARGVRDDDRADEFTERISGWFELMTGQPAPAIPSTAAEAIAHGVGRAREIEHPMARGFALHALLIASRPFPDANGRIARACLSAELASDGQSRLVIPGSTRRAYADACRLYRDGGDVAALGDVFKRAHAAR